MQNSTKGFYHPDFSEIAFSLGSPHVRWYSLAYLAGIMLGWFYVKYINKKISKTPINEEIIDSLPMWMILSIVLGGRLGYVLFYNFEYYSNNISEAFKIWEGGMSFHGGLLGVIVGIYIFSKFHKINYFRISDLISIAAPIGLFFGRIANFINKELYGRYTESVASVIYPGETIGRHPSQIYEALTEGLLLFLELFFLAIKRDFINKTALSSGVFLIGYAISRSFCEIFREPDEQIGYLFGFLTMGQILCIPLFIVGIWVIWLNGIKKSSKIK